MQIQKRILFDEKTLAEFDKIFPEGSLSWALNMLLEKFVRQFQHTPEEYAEIATKELKEEIGK